MVLCSCCELHLLAVWHSYVLLNSDVLIVSGWSRKRESGFSCVVIRQGGLFNCVFGSSSGINAQCTIILYMNQHVLLRIPEYFCICVDCLATS